MYGIIKVIFLLTFFDMVIEFVLTDMAMTTWGEKKFHNELILLENKCLSFSHLHCSGKSLNGWLLVQFLSAVST